MRFAAASLALVSALGLFCCRKDSPPGFAREARPAPVLTPGIENAPVIEAPRPRHEVDRNGIVRTIPSGTTIQVRNNEPISLATAEAGRTFPALVARDVVAADGRVAIPRGSAATLMVLRAGVLDIGGVVVAGRSYGVEAVKSGDAGTRAGQIPAGTLLGFRLEGPARIREIPHN